MCSFLKVCHVLEKGLLKSTVKFSKNNHPSVPEVIRKGKPDKVEEKDGSNKVKRGERD